MINLHAAVERSESVNENSPRCLQRGDNDRPVDGQKSISNDSVLCVWLIRQTTQILAIQESQLCSKQIVSNGLAVLFPESQLDLDLVVTESVKLKCRTVSSANYQ